MNATSALVLILVLSFAADRIAQAVLFLLSHLGFWSQRFPDPRFVQDEKKKTEAKDRYLVVYTVLVAIFSGIAVCVYPELRIIRMLSGPSTHDLIDILVTLLVVMGGSDLVGRIVQISGIGDIGPAGQSIGRNQPIEISGRLVLEDSDRLERSRQP